MNNLQKQKYRNKAKDSFKTKKNLFLFHSALRKIESFSEMDFEKFTISEKLVKQYTSEYWQEYEDSKIGNLTIKQISNKIEVLEESNTALLKRLENNYVDSFHLKFPEEKFTLLISQDQCHYCGITLKEIAALGETGKLYKKNYRGWTLEIDRLNSNFEYTPENCVMSCYWCNNAKTDEFSESEFIEIAKGIKIVWENRLK